METLPKEMVEAVAGWLDFRDRVRLSGVSPHLRRHAFRGYAIDIPQVLGRPGDVAKAKTFPSFFASLETAVAGGAHFNRVAVVGIPGMGRSDWEAVLELVQEAEAEKPKLLFFEPGLALGVPYLSSFSALRGLRLVDFQHDIDGLVLAASAHLPALKILEIFSPFLQLQQLNQIPIQRLTDLRLFTCGYSNSMHARLQYWLDSQPSLPLLRSLRLVSHTALLLDWAKVPALRWLEGNFVLGNMAQLSLLERWSGLSVRSTGGVGAALGAVLANPARPPGLPLLVNAADSSKHLFESAMTDLRPPVDMNLLRWYSRGDELPKGFHCPRTGWTGFE